MYYRYLRALQEPAAAGDGRGDASGHCFARKIPALSHLNLDNRKKLGMM